MEKNKLKLLNMHAEAKATHKENTKNYEQSNDNEPKLSDLTYSHHM